MHSILFIGCGKMGGAIVNGLYGNHYFDIHVIEPEPIKLNQARLYKSINELAKPAFDALVFAIKPQQADEILPEYRKFTNANTVVISIMAGVSTERVLKAFNPLSVPVVRTMPNLPATVNKGITAAFSAKHLTAVQQNIVEKIFQSVGKLLWLKEENLLDAVTAVSGSGPAYVFLLCEALEKAGIAAGLPADIAADLARHTITGSAELMLKSHLSSTGLREAVTSPGGTTEAAMKILMPESGGLTELMKNAVLAAQNRSKEL